jgi:hypothetical protein
MFVAISCQCNKHVSLLGGQARLIDTTHDTCLFNFGELRDPQMMELKWGCEKYICRAVDKWSCAGNYCSHDGRHNVDFHGMLCQTAGCVIDNSCFLWRVVTILQARVSNSVSDALVAMQLKGMAGWIRFFAFSLYRLMKSNDILDHEICAILGYYAAYSGSSLSTFRENQSVPFSRVISSTVWWKPKIVLSG